MNALIDAAVHHARTVLTSLVCLLIAGIYAYNAIPKERDPDVNIPIIYVSMHLEGISPEDAERLLVRPMEEELRSIEGTKEMSSTAYEGGANVLLEFDAGFDPDIALDDVREKVDLVRPELPDDADEPTVNEVNISLFPILVVTLSGDVPERTLVQISRDLRDKLEGIASVLEVNIGGDREESVEIIVDPLLIESYGLNGLDVVNLFNRSNQLVAAGTLDTGKGRFAVKVPGLFESVSDIMNMPVRVSDDGVVRLSDIAVIRRTFKDPEGFARVDGKPAVALEVSKRIGSNIIETIEAVKEIVAEEQQYWPNTIEVNFSQDASIQIRSMLGDLQNNVTSAILLVMIVIVGALGLRSAGLVGVAIPASFMTGILMLYVLGLTSNIVVLFSLILAVGLLVDGAIVVTEYAARRMSEGQPKVEAYAEAGKRMAWPIIASTATTLAAFVPLLFWPGIVGEFMKYLPMTLIAVLSASLVVALIFVPTLGAVFGKAPKPGADGEAIDLEKEGPLDMSKLKGLNGRYVRMLSAALRHPGKILIAAFATLIAMPMVYGTFGKGVEFFPDVEPEQGIVLIHARGNMSIWEQDQIVYEVEQEVLKLSDEFKSIYTRTGAGGDGDDVAEDVIGQISLEFEDWDKRRPAAEIYEDIRALTRPLAGIYVEVRSPEAGPPTGKPVQVQLTSRFPELLPGAIDKVRSYLEAQPGLLDVEDSRPIPGIDWKLDLDRAQALKFGVDTTSLGDTVKLVTRGLKVGEYRPDDSDEELDMMVRYPEAQRSMNQLDEVRVVIDGPAIPISNFVSRYAQQKTGNINRIDGKRVMDVQANVAEGVLPDDIVTGVREWLATEANLDPRIDVVFKGEDEEQQAAQSFLMRAFAVALFMMAIILVTQFNSFYSALLILSAVIMSTIGVLMGLLITGQPFGIIMTGIGVIALAGIVVNNNIVLIDTFDRLKKTAADQRDAILKTGAQRLRPVLLTTVTTVLGLMPMVLQMNIDFVNRSISYGAPSTQWWVGLATAVVFGLTFATVLTLVVTPCSLMLRANVQGWLAKRRAAKSEQASETDAGDGSMPTPLPQAAE